MLILAAGCAYINRTSSVLYSKNTARVNTAPIGKLPFIAVQLYSWGKKKGGEGGKKNTQSNNKRKIKQQQAQNQQQIW